MAPRMKVMLMRVQRSDCDPLITVVRKVVAPKPHRNTSLQFNKLVTCNREYDTAVARQAAQSREATTSRCRSASARRSDKVSEPPGAQPFGLMAVAGDLFV